MQLPSKFAVDLVEVSQDRVLLVELLVAQLDGLLARLDRRLFRLEKNLERLGVPLGIGSTSVGIDGLVLEAVETQFERGALLLPQRPLPEGVLGRLRPDDLDVQVVRLLLLLELVRLLRGDRKLLRSPREVLLELLVLGR